MSKSPQQRAELRCCASCKWIFKGLRDCPKCGFASYGVRFVYGDKAYKYAKTQRPWADRKMAEYSIQLDREIRAALSAAERGE